MSHLNPGLLAAYNSLTDKHLTGYFNNARIRRHLQKVGLITRSGRIVPDKEYKHKLIQRAHQRHVRECLAQAIFHKVLDMERLHQTEIKRKLEEFARRERIHKLKTERSKRYEDEPMLMLSPRPPTGPKISHARNSGPEGEHSESTESPGSSRPNTAPGKMQRPVRLKPLNSNSATASLKRTSPRYRLQDRESSNDTDQPLSYTLDRDTMRHLTMTDFSSTVSPYRLPVINNYVTPVPPLTKKKERGPRVNGTLRGRRLRPTTAPTAPTEPSTLQRTSAQSKVSVRMVFFGKSVHLSHDLMDLRDEVKVFQQHCGGENLCVFKGKLKEGEMFQFVSRRHRGFPFSLTFFLNGLQVDRLSSCCEFKHRKGARLGGKHGHFGFCGVEGASPCYKCIIAMGLDKKPTPPLKRVKEELPTSKSPDEKEATDVDEEIDTHTNAGPDRSQEMETQPNGETAQQKKPKDDYEEDFEADDEGPVEDGDEVDEKPSPAANDGEIENETRDVNEKNRDSDSEAEDIDVSKDKRAMSVSSGRTSSLSSSDGDNSEREIDGDTKEVPEVSLQPEEDTTETKMDETESESSPVTLTQAAEEDPGTRENPGDGMEKSEQETSEDTETKGGTEGEVEDETKPEDKPQESEPERAAKSMQEKLSEAILKESQCSSEPELSDTSTEEDEGASVKTQQDSKEAESAVTPSSPQQLNTQEDIPEESEVNTQKAACKETAHGIETGQPAEGTIPEETYTNTEEEKEEKEEKEEITASLEIEKKQEEEESDRKNEVEEDEKDELQLESEAQTEGDKQEVEGEVKDEDKINEIVEVSNESKEEEMSKSKDSSGEEPKTNPQTLNTSNNGNEDTTVMENEIPETESATENENSEFHIENETETGASDIERQGDADQNTGRKSNGQTDGDERDGWTNETSNDRSTGEKVQETDGMVDDEGSVVTEKDEEKSGDQRVHGKELDEIMNGEEVQEDKTVVEERPEELENGVNNEDQGIEVTEKEGEIQASEKKIELEEYEDSKSEDKEKEVDIVREESGVNDKQEVINKEQSCEAEDKENELDGEAFIPENEDHDEQKEPENEKQVRNKFSDRPMEEGQENGGDEIVGGETEQAKDENAENGEQEVKKEAEVEDEKRDEVEEAVSENCVENETKEWENKNELETGEKLIEDLKCDEAETEVTDVNEITENAEVKDVKEEALSGESVAQKSEDSIMDQNEKPVSHEEEKEIISSGMPKDDTGPSIKEDAGETLPAVVNNDQLACNIDAENGEAGNFSQEEAEKEEYSKDEKVPDKLEGEGSVDSSQKVVNDGETDKEEKEEEIDDEKEQGTEKDTETKSDVALSERESQKEGEHEDQGNDDQKSDRVDDKPMTEEPGRESETSAAAFRENIDPENLTKDAESEIIFSEEDGVDDKPMTEEPDMESETSAATFRENIDPENLAKDAESEIIVSEEAGAMEEPHDTESELKGSNGELRSREAPEGENFRAKDGEPEEPGEKKENSINEEKSASSVSHSVESQPVERVSALKKDEKDPVLSADSEEPAIRPAALAKADGADLVSNWINIHQTSRYFQTFIEPLDEIKEGVISDETEKWPNGEVLDATDTIPSTDFGGHDETLTSRDEIAAPSENDHNENTEPDTLVESFKQETKAEASEADAQSEPSENNKHDPANDEGVKNGRDTRGSLVASCSKQSDDVDTHQKETDGQEAPTSNVVMNLETEVATTENIQDVPTETEQDLLRNYELNSSFQEESKQNKQETTVDEITSLSSISQREGEGNKETLESSEHNLKSEHVAQSEFIEPESPTITVITDLTIINKSENGSQDDTASVDFHSKKSDGSRDTDENRGTKVIDGSFKQTLSQDRLSTFPLDDSRFYGPAGYPRLTTANTENSY